MLHVLNGDAAVPSIEVARLSGRTTVWRECLSEGPAPPRWDARASWFARTGLATQETIRREWQEAHAALATAQKEDEVVLWFDADLFCQANLAYLAEALPEGPRITLASGTHARKAPTDVRDIFATRVPFPRETYRAAWRAFTADDPTDLLDVPLAFVGHHLARFPDAGGLGALERRTLEAMARVGLDLGALQPVVAAGGFGDALGLTDLMLREAVAELVRGPRPLYQGGRLTELGADVLARRADNVAERGIDRWVGGAHLLGKGPVWRFADGALAIG